MTDSDLPDETGPSAAESEQRTVEIEDIGDQGDGIARVDRGYVIIVPDTEEGEQVAVKITDVSAMVGFAELVDWKNDNSPGEDY